MIAAGLVLASERSTADVITTLNFVSPGATSPLTVPVGTTVTFDLGVTFIPLPGMLGTPFFIDNVTGMMVASCATDPNPCSAIQINTTNSTLTSVFAEAVAGNAPGAPNFFPTTMVGTSTFSQAYPNPGLWEITTAGTDQEQFNQVQCTTLFTNMIPGTPNCMIQQTFSFTGTFDLAGHPMIFVNAVAAAVPEPPSLMLLAAGLLGFWGFFGVRRRPKGPDCRPTYLS